MSSVSPGRTEICATCLAELRCCRNCASFDKHAADQCQERRAEPVLEKDRGNFCEYFQFAIREWSENTPSAPSRSREQAARDALKSLLGD